MEELTDSQPQMQTVFESGDVWIYRIPALLYKRESETILAFAERRTSPSDNNAERLVVKTGKLKKTRQGSDERTIEWSESRLVEEAHLAGHRTMNPCPVYEKTSKTLFLFFICVEGTVSEGWQIQHFHNKARLCYVTSQDVGQSWSQVTDLTESLDEIKNWATFAVGPGHGLQMRSGRLIIPTYAYARCCAVTKKVAPRALSLYSDDSGQTWQFGKMLQNESIECEMAEFFDDDENSFVYCNARRRGGHREEAVCGSSGHFTSKANCAKMLVETDGGCQGSVVSFPAQGEGAHDLNESQNKWLLFTHPTHKSKRIDLGVYLNRSPCDPEAWSKPWIISNGPSGYSDLAYTGAGWFVCLVECGQQNITEQIASLVFSYDEMKRRIGE